MATGARNIIALHILLQISAIIHSGSADFPDFAVVQDVAGRLHLKLIELLEDSTMFSKVQNLYQEESKKLDFQPLEGLTLVTDLANKLGALLKKKVVALRKSVAWAEEVAKEYKWNGEYERGDIDYVDTKNINESDPSYEYSEKFKQYANFGNSSVHIPVEIYDGNIDILNGLKWSSRLDEQWQRNLQEDPDLLWQYFGSQDGIMRNYPATAWLGPEPDLYDVRRRPWYTQGASSPKDMMIMIDTSGSTYGQGIKMIKESAKSLLETLGEDDFVNIGSFAKDASYVVPCFDTFVQANYWNKLVLKEFVDNLTSQYMASYVRAFEFAFEDFASFNREENMTESTGAMCNRVIMFLTDGGTEMPQEVFDKYNPDKRIRIFTYAVGPTANPIAAVKWIACANRGYFYKIPAMGAIRSVVQHYYRPIGNVMAANDSKEVLWSRTYADTMGLGMMTTVTLPVYNRTLDSSNQTILGVMGNDLTVNEMVDLLRNRQIGPNGYTMAINSNGYIVFHPDLKAHLGYVTDPANVDFLDLEFSTEEKEEVRKAMIDGETGQSTISTIIYVPDERHVVNRSRIYHYSPIPGSTFSLGLVLPEYAQLFINDRVDPIPIEQGIRSLLTETSSVLIAPWQYCNDVAPVLNSTDQDAFIEALQRSTAGCDETLLQQLLTDANVTAQMVGDWMQAYESGVGFEAFFAATESGLTRVFPANASFMMEEDRDPWKSIYYKRAFDSDDWVYSAPRTFVESENVSSLPIMISKAVSVDVSSFQYKPGVVGAWVSQQWLRSIMFERMPSCEDVDLYSCYLVDDGGFLLVSNDENEESQAGTFFGDQAVEPVLMQQLVDDEVFLRNIQNDYQSACQNYSRIISAGTRIYIPTFFYDMLSISWWTSKFTWSLLNLNIYNWLFNEPEDYSAYASDDEIIANMSCVKTLAQYMFSEGENTEHKSEVICDNCTRTFATARIKQSNLLFVMVEKDCGSHCEKPIIPHGPMQVPDPNFEEAGVPRCNYTQRYRRRPPSCFDYNPDEDTSDCSGGLRLGATYSAMIISLMLTCVIGFLRQN